MSELKPCPFCGSDMEGTVLDHKDGFSQGSYGSLSVACSDCGTIGPYDFTMPEAIKAWNTRQEGPEVYPGDLEAHDSLEKTLEVVRQGYGWIIGEDGRLYGLIAGDMGYCATCIVVDDFQKHFQERDKGSEDD